MSLVTIIKELWSATACNTTDQRMSTIHTVSEMEYSICLSLAIKLQSILSNLHQLAMSSLARVQLILVWVYEDTEMPPTISFYILLTTDFGMLIYTKDKEEIRCYEDTKQFLLFFLKFLVIQYLFTKFCKK